MDQRSVSPKTEPSEADKKPKPKAEQREPAPAAPEVYIDQVYTDVDEASMESFPASDPPSYTPLRAA